MRRTPVASTASPHCTHHCPGQNFRTPTRTVPIIHQRLRSCENIIIHWPGNNLVRVVSVADQMRPLLIRVDLDYTSYLPSIDTASPGTFEMPKDNVPYKGAGASDTKHPIKTKVIMATKGVNEVLDPSMLSHLSIFVNILIYDRFKNPFFQILQTLSCKLFLVNKRFPTTNLSYLKSFKLLWPEPRGGTRHPDAIEGSYPGNYGEPIHYSVQRFIIVASSDGHCQCV